MSKRLARAEAWESVYQAYQNINFTAFDMPTVKEALLDYLKLYFREQFNDFIESSEIIAIVEMFAYISELYAYRSDVNAHENLLPVADRKESILRLAKNVSYKATRNLPARGLVKLTSVQTTQTVIDSKGRNLAGRKITYNDLTNPDWKEQFLLILEKVLEQPFGSVLPSDRRQIDDVLLEVYGIKNNPVPNSVLTYRATYGGVSLPMELVPVSLNDSGPVERTPEYNGKLSLLYGNDGLGDGSPTSGFFFFTKQGTMRLETATFDGTTPNQTHIVDVPNINETDVWVNQVDPDTLRVVDEDASADQISGFWQQVDLAFAQNIIYNTNPFRNKYEVEALDQDRVRIIFGDGEYANVPSGMFHIWYRTSTGADTVVPANAVVDKAQTINYQDDLNRVQTLNFTFSLVNTLQNGAASEDPDHIRRVAPAVYYTQDRMVNARDYNTFLLQDPTILKLRAINRTFAGDSKHSVWHDPSDTHTDVDTFGDDLALYVEDTSSSIIVPDVTSPGFLISQYIVPILSTVEMFSLQTHYGVLPINVRTAFTPIEADNLTLFISQRIQSSNVAPIEMYLMSNEDGTNTWDFVSNTEFEQDTKGPLITVTPSSNGEFKVQSRGAQLVAHSDNTRFWIVNPQPTVDYRSLTAASDTVTVLKANIDNNRTSTLNAAIGYTAVQQCTIAQGLPDAGLLDTHRVVLIGKQETGIPTGVSISRVAHQNRKVYEVITGTGTNIDLGASYLRTDLQVTGGAGMEFVTSHSRDLTETEIVDTVTVLNYGDQPFVEINTQDYVYLVRPSLQQQFVVAENSIENLQAYVDHSRLDIPQSSRIWKRFVGRFPLNFHWQHIAPFYTIVDPCPTNIIDAFVMTKGYHSQYNAFLLGNLAQPPKQPTPFELRSSYKTLLDNRMISDVMVLKPGIIKPIFGNKSAPQLRAKFKIVQSKTSTITTNQLKIRIVDTIRQYFNIQDWEFGQTLYFTELSAAIHAALPLDVASCTLVPSNVGDQFGDLYQIDAREDEILQPDVDVTLIEIISSLDSANLRQNG